MWDPCEYQEGRNPGEYRKWGIRMSTRNVGSECRIRASTKNGGNPGKYREGGIRASTGNVGSGRVLEMGNLGEMLENPKQAKRSKQTQGKRVGPSMTSRVCQQMTRISQKSNTIMTKEGMMPQYGNRKCHK